MKTKSLVLIVIAMSFGMFIFGATVSTMLNAKTESDVSAPTFNPPRFSFLRDLRLGDDNQDVRQLQVLLNGDFSTRISDVGVGSKGQESTYFGQLTANAVLRFQLRNQIRATGIVDATTRTKLNQIASNIPVVPAPFATTTKTTISKFSGPLPLANEKLPRLYTARPQQIRKGETFTLVGDGFQVENTVHIGSHVFSRVLPQDSSNISFKIPASSAIENGNYEVWVENSKGTSKVSGQSIEMTVTDNPTPASVISSVFPKIVSGAEKVTVTGSGFSSSGNSIVSGFGTIKNISSNGNQITFSPRSLISKEVLSRILAGSTITIDFYIVNANGPSNVYGSVDLKI